MRAARIALKLLGLFGALALAAPARADGPLGPNGAPIRTSDYRIDQFQGPVLASSRVIALGGAYTALAEGAEGIAWNPAAVSQRYPYSTTRDDWDLNAGVTFPSSVKRTDFDNNGRRGFEYDNFVFLTAGGYIQHDRWGIGASLAMQQYDITRSATSPLANDFVIRILKLDVVTSYALFNEQLHVGGGVRGSFFAAVNGTGTSESLLFGTNGAGVQGGVLWTPRGLPLRVGGTVRSPIWGAVASASEIKPDSAGDRVLGDLYLPSRVQLPWEVEWGVAVQLGKRPLNLPWYDEDKVDPAIATPEQRKVERKIGTQKEPLHKTARRILRRQYAAIPREKLLVSFSMLASGPLANAVGIESMLARTVERSGERPTLTTRLGLEGEVLPNRLQLRAGTYVEPTRFQTSEPRVHATTGFELRFLKWTVFDLYPEDTSFRLSGAVDVARDYFGWSIGLGLWR